MNCLVIAVVWMTTTVCERPAGAWDIISLAMDSEVALTGQERGKDLEYQVIAINKAGGGIPNNIVDAVV